MSNFNVKQAKALTEEASKIVPEKLKYILFLIEATAKRGNNSLSFKNLEYAHQQELKRRGFKVQDLGHSAYLRGEDPYVASW